MLTETTISDGRTVVIDLEPMTIGQQRQIATAIADFLVRSGQIRTDVALSGPRLLQFLSEAADMVQQQAVPVDPADVVVFEAKANEHSFRGHGHFLAVPDDLLVRRTVDTAFDEGCDAIHTVNGAILEDQHLAEATATLLNRAFWLGQGRCAPFHVTPRS